MRNACFLALDVLRAELAQVHVELEHGREAKVFTGTQDIGTGTRTALCQVAAETLGIAPERVSIELGDTASGLRTTTSAGSTTLASVGPALRQAALAAKERGTGRGKRGNNRKDKAIRTCGAQAVEVEVDTETGEVRVLRVVAAHDCGRVINTMLV